MSSGSTIVVHGGAGAEPIDERDARRAGVARAARTGHAILAAGGSALDAVLAAVVVLEDDPVFNAGLGSVLTEDGHVETDASVMEGTQLTAGAIGALRGVANPILLADAVRREGREVLLVGDGALAVARRAGLRLVDPASMITEPALRRHRERRPASGETVGAVARDAHGGTAAATSTGGLDGKRPGRIGDSAVIGCGTYADDRVGAGSATGPGEAIIRVTLVRTALERVARGEDARAAVHGALAVLRERTGEAAGLILVDAHGAVGAACTTPAMAAAWIAGDGALTLF